MPSHRLHRTETVIVGGGLAGLVTALELIDQKRRVIVLECGGPEALGGLALQAFGGMHFVDSPLQRRQGIRDSQELGLADWHSYAEFEADDLWPKKWAEHYIARCIPDAYDWLKRLGMNFIPAVQWAERGWYRPGNSVPRYHVLWGTGQHLSQALIEALRTHPCYGRVEILPRHKVVQLSRGSNGLHCCSGVAEDTGTPFTIEAEHVIVASGGITGNLEKVRENWPRGWGPAPSILLNGSQPSADGALHDAVAAMNGRVTHLDQMWNYAAGVHHPHPQFPGHGLSLVPCKSALWMDHQGRRIGPEPLVAGFDTRHLVERVSRLPRPYTWQILNGRIAARELAVSGAEHNPAIRDRRRWAFLKQLLFGNTALVRQMVLECEDFITAQSVCELALKMNLLNDDTNDVDVDVLGQEIHQYDDQIARGPRFHNDDQLRRIAQLRGWLGDRLRTSGSQKILDPAAGPLIAIRTFVVTRKTLGGIQTDLHSRVLDTGGRAIPGLYAVGEAAGFGGGGSSGKRSLEGTCLTGCILTARAAADAVISGVESDPLPLPAPRESRNLTRASA